MTGRQRVEAAFAGEGARHIPAVICYEGIFLRDHWKELTSCPWWYRHTPDADLQIKWQREAAARTGLDWFKMFPWGVPDPEVTIEERSSGVFAIDQRTGRERELPPPQVGGWNVAGQTESVRTDQLPENIEDVDALIPIDSIADQSVTSDRTGYALGTRLVREFGGELYPYRQVCGPLWQTYELWGFEGMMVLIATRPDLVEYACRRNLALSVQTVGEAAAQGAAAIWIEDCLTDMISPDAFAALNVPFVRRLVEEIRAAGMKSIYYFAGNPAGKWDLILAIGADALTMEESKKNFRIDIRDIVERVRGRCTILGNLDAIGILQNGSEAQLRAEIARQIAAGRGNDSRFIMSLGSPVTPQTPVERVRLYCDLVHELGGT